MDLTGAEDIKKRWQEYKEEQFKKKNLMTQKTTIVGSITYIQTYWSPNSGGP